MSDSSNNKDDGKENNNYISKPTKKAKEGKRASDTDI